ncbi:hypothetical protein MFLO_07697 [Listeria floridensis FSL S10-1187]|uniref:Tetratricopeptide repeat protein n=2 Tax=Listeria floridensis TaxID=1494962 RepID=A0ABN0RFJ5_9LIST|nr:hypothetical protein MFLO_07697 [Listeria floridensis FSL S10-1187]
MVLENPSHFAGYLCLAYMDWICQDLDEASRNIELALSYNQNILESYQVGIEIYVARGNHRRVTELARAGLLLDYTAAEFYAALAEHHAGSYREKAALYQEALKYAPERIDYMGRLAFYLFQIDPRDKQILALQNLALAREPMFEANLVYFADISYARGDFEAAREFARKLCVIDPENPDYQALAAKMQLTKNPFWSIYERTRLLTHRIPIPVTAGFVILYAVVFLVLLRYIGYTSVLMLVVPLVIIIAAIISKTDEPGKMGIQDRQNRYVRLPIAIVLLIGLLIPAGVRVAGTVLQYAKEVRQEQRITTVRQQQVSKATIAGETASTEESRRRVPSESDNALFFKGVSANRSDTSALPNGEPN